MILRKRFVKKSPYVRGLSSPFVKVIMKQSKFMKWFLEIETIKKEDIFVKNLSVCMCTKISKFSRPYFTVTHQRFL